MIKKKYTDNDLVKESSSLKYLLGESKIDAKRNRSRANKSLAERMLRR